MATTTPSAASLHAALAETDPARRIGLLMHWFDGYAETALRMDVGMRTTLACAEYRDVRHTVCVPGAVNAPAPPARRIAAQIVEEVTQ